MRDTDCLGNNFLLFSVIMLIIWFSYYIITTVFFLFLRCFYSFLNQIYVTIYKRPPKIDNKNNNMSSYMNV